MPQTVHHIKHHKHGKHRTKPLLIISSIILCVLVGVSVYFIVENEQSKNTPGRCNHSKGYVWSQRLKRCVKGYGS